MRRFHAFTFAGLALCALTVAACGKKNAAPATDTAAGTVATPPPPAASVSTIAVGKHLTADKSITDTTSTFAPRDTLYLSVVTANAGASNTLKTKWTFQTGQVVDSSSQTVAPPTTAGGSSVTEFHLTKPTGWPVGTYTVEIWLDGQSVGTRQITVKR